MIKKLLLLLFCLFSFSAIHAKIDWKLENGTLTISGTVDMLNYDSPADVPWYNDRKQIEKVIIEYWPTSIGDWTFYQCERLTSITIPNSVTSIGNHTFENCERLTSITIPNSVTSIGKSAFERSGLTSISIPNSVTSIGESAFAYCTYLTSVTIPNSVTSIGGNAFYYCTSLTSVTIPNSVTSIGKNAFYECESLTSLTIPNSVTSIGDCAFQGCGSLTSLTIPNSVTSIGERAFENCSSLTSLTIPNSVTSIGNYAFRYCSGLASITVEKGNTKYDSRDNCNAIIETNTNKLIAGCKNTTIPNSVMSIGDYAFDSCSGLTSITIPNSVTSIGNYAFRNCSGLTSITIPNSVTSIGNWAFSYCSGLTSITFERSTPPEFGKYVFKYVSNSIPVYVPTNSIEAYKNVLGGLDLSNIKVAPISLTDDEPYTKDSRSYGVEVSYTRNFTNVNWQAIYLPFALRCDELKNDFEIAFVNGVSQTDKDDDGVIDETVIEIIKMTKGSTTPNAPYLIRAKTTGEKTFSAKSTTVEAAKVNSVDCSTTMAKFTITGTYNEIPSETMIANDYYGMGGGKLIKSDGSNGLKPFRWYMKVESRDYSKYDVNNAAKSITIKVLDEEETTGVAELQTANSNSSVYDINGRKVNENSLKPGIYVKNGKKFVVK